MAEWKLHTTDELMGIGLIKTAGGYRVVSVHKPIGGIMKWDVLTDPEHRGLANERAKLEFVRRILALNPPPPPKD